MALAAQIKKNEGIFINDAPPNIQSLIRTYIGLLIGNNEMSVYSAGKITPEMLPSSMTDERNILRAILECVKEGIPAMPNYVEAKLAVNNWQVSQNAVTVMANGVGSEWRANTTNSVSLCSSVIRQWHFENDGMNAWKRAAEIMNDPARGDYQTRYNEAKKQIVHVSPTTESTRIVDDLRLVADGIAEYEKKRKLLLEKGKFPNPVPHLASLREMGISFFDGEYSLLLGHEGTGKSSFAQQLAENIAWEQGLGYDVAYISLETNFEKLAFRTLSRNLGVPMNDFVKFQVDTKSPEYLEVYNAFIERRARAEENSGAVLYVTVGEKTPSSIIDAIHQCHLVSMSSGRKLFVIVDHIGRIEKPRFFGSNDANAITESVVSISNACNSINTHVMFLGHTDNVNGTKLFGATQVNKNAQIVLVLKAESPDGGVKFDEPAVDYLGRKMADYLGRPRWFQRTGNKHEGKVEIYIEKSNDSSGGSVKVWCERPMGNIFSDIPDELERIKSL